MKLKPRHLPLAPASETALWEWLTPQIDYRILNDLCGWMNYNKRENLAGLEALRNEFTVERALGEPPNEILELERWSKESGLQPGYDKRKFHLSRAWCCTALLRATAHKHGRQQGDNLGEELFPLIESLLALGDVAPGHGLTFVRWLAERWAGTAYMVQSYLMLAHTILVAGVMRHALSSLFEVERAERQSGEPVTWSDEDAPQCYLSDLSGHNQNLLRFVTAACLMLDGHEGLVERLQELSQKIGTRPGAP